MRGRVDLGICIGGYHDIGEDNDHSRSGQQPRPEEAGKSPHADGSGAAEPEDAGDEDKQTAVGHGSGGGGRKPGNAPDIIRPVGSSKRRSIRRNPADGVQPRSSWPPTARNTIFPPPSRV